MACQTVDTFTGYETGGYHIGVWLDNCEDGQAIIACGDSTESKLSIVRDTRIPIGLRGGEGHVTCETISGLKLVVDYSAQHVDGVSISTSDGLKKLERL
jgi:hypothetical protein